MTIKGEPEFFIVTKLPNSMPQYEVGHIDRIRHIQKHIEDNYNNLILTGASFDAVGLPRLCSNGENASDKMIIIKLIKDLYLKIRLYFYVIHIIIFSFIFKKSLKIKSIFPFSENCIEDVKSTCFLLKKVKK